VTVRPLHVRWLGRVRYRDGLALQHGLFRDATDDHLLLCEHDPVVTLGARADERHVLADLDALGIDRVRADRGGDVTYHGPGQLTGYPIRHVAGKRGGGMVDTVAYVTDLTRLLVDVLAELGLPGCECSAEFPGVWVPGAAGPRKIAAVGVRLARGRSMHGFGLNVTDEALEGFRHIVPCGIADRGVTSLQAEGVDVSMREVVDVVARLAAERWGSSPVDRADVAWRRRPDDLAPFSRGAGAGAPVRLVGRLAEAGVTDGLTIATRKPDWLRPRVQHGPEVLALRRTLRDLDLVTVCEEAGCPNLSECWAEGTATFMINGERCTRACGFCLVDTSHPLPLDPDEPARVADAVARLGLRFAVVTAVARDDLPDGGAGAFAATIRAIRARVPGCGVEVLVPDCKGDPDALATVFDAAPDVLNHNIETVPRLQRAVRPSASYARSLAVLARARAAGLRTKTSIIVGMGETDDEIVATLGDLAAIGVDIVTLGQYLRPTTHHLPVDRWVPPDRFDHFREVGRMLGLAHVESGPLVRSSYHARSAADAAVGNAAV